MLLDTLDFLLRFLVLFGSMSILLFLAISLENMFYENIYGVGLKMGQGRNILKQFAAEFFRLLCLGNHSSTHRSMAKVYFSTVGCLCIALLPFLAFPLHESFSLTGKTHTSEYHYLKMGVLFVLLVQVFGQVVIYIIQQQNNYLQDIFVLRKFVNYINSKALSLLVLLPLIAIYASVDFHDIVKIQSSTLTNFLPSYGIFLQPISAILFLVCMQMESGIGMFGNAEDSGDLGRCHYQNLDGREIFLLEFTQRTHWFGLVLLYVFVFLGGYGVFPGLDKIISIIPQSENFIQFFSLVIKVIIVVFILTVITTTLPRLRARDGMDLSFKKLIPLAFVNFLCTLGYLFYREVYL